MSLLTRHELKGLIEQQEGEACVSIFMPTYRTGPEVQQGRIRLKNLLDQAEMRLTLAGLRAPEARKLLEPARNLQEDDFFWLHQSDGLALFLSSNLFRIYRLPLSFEEVVIVSDRFHFKPLLPLLSGDGRFYVLALSQNGVRLLEGTRHSIRELAVEDMPGSLAEALRFDEPEKQQQFHTATQAARGERPAMFHGQGVSADDEKNDILRYFQQVDKGLQALFQNERAPLVFAGVEYLFPIYQQANGYQYLIDEFIEGNPEELSAEVLHERAWTILEPYFEQGQKEAVARYQELANTTGQTSDALEEIVPAAYYGRVDTLFVALGFQRWGRFEPETQTLHLHQEEQPHDEELLDSAAVQTLLNGGTVYAVEPEAVPDDTPLAAVFRY